MIFPLKHLDSTLLQRLFEDNKGMWLIAMNATQGKFYMEHTEVSSNYFPASSREEYLDLLIHLSRYSNTLLLLLGQNQVGKSTLLYRFIETVKRSSRVFNLEATTNLNPIEFIEAIQQHFDLPPNINREIETRLLIQRQLDHFRLTQDSFIIIVDDAENLNNDTLNSIAQYIDEQQTFKNVYVHFVLAAKPGLQRRVEIVMHQHASLEAMHNIFLSGFNFEDTCHYVERLLSAKKLAFSQWSEKILKRIYQISAGCPGRINELVEQEISKQASDNNHFKATSVMHKNLKLVGVISLISLIVTLAYLLTLPLKHQHPKQLLNQKKILSSEYLSASRIPSAQVIMPQEIKPPILLSASLLPSPTKQMLATMLYAPERKLLTSNSAIVPKGNFYQKWFAIEDDTMIEANILVKKKQQMLNGNNTIILNNERENQAY